MIPILILLDKDSKFKVKVVGRDSVAEVMKKFVDRTSSKGLIAKENNFQGVPPGYTSPKFVNVVRDYFAEFNVDVATFLET
ncbi:hypothetical protein GOBAR_DD10993 [Gossypium barbadense]|nr:hypothetical protein GOBAR_DD10993 [Gossypium barbadense]